MLARPDPVDWIPVADSFAMKDCYVIQVDLPGVEKESLKVLVAGGECHVSGRREHPSGNGECRPVSVERPRGRFERRFGLPPGYHADEVTAKYKDGVLEVRVEVEESGAPREMKVQVT